MITEESETLSPEERRRVRRWLLWSAAALLALAGTTLWTLSLDEPAPDLSAWPTEIAAAPADVARQAAINAWLQQVGTSEEVPKAIEAGIPADFTQASHGTFADEP